MKNKTFNAYCEKCDVDNYIKGIEEKVTFTYLGLYANIKILTCPKRHNYEWDEIMKYQVKRKK